MKCNVLFIKFYEISLSLHLINYCNLVFS